MKIKRNHVLHLTYHVSRTQGFTLIEIMTVAFLIVIIVGGLLTFTIYYLKNYSYSFTASQQIGQVQTGLTWLIRDIREVRKGADGSWPIVDAQDNSFTFYSDVTNDGRADRVRYFLDGQQLKKGVIEPILPLVTYPATQEKITIVADYVNTGGKPIFTYYNGNWPGDTTNNPLVVSKRNSDARFVNVYLRISVNATSGTQPFEMTQGVEMRSLKDNL